MDVLYCDHNIFLSKEQRYSLYKGEEVSVVGTNISILDSKKFKDPNNFVEKFYLYRLIPKKSIFKKIKKTKQGFNIYLSNKKLKNNLFDLLKVFFLSQSIEKDTQESKRLLDVKDGGSEWLFLQEKEFKKNLIVFHRIQIQKIETLKENLV